MAFVGLLAAFALLPGQAAAQVETECPEEAPDSDGDGRADCADQETGRLPAIGALLRTLPGGLPSGSTECTATLVGCSTVLTAASCVCHADADACLPGAAKAPKSEEYSVFFHGLGRFSVEQIDVHPDFSGAPGYGSDLALLHLAGDVNGIAPLRLGRTAPVAGTEVEHLGFGAQVTAGGPRFARGVKRALPAVVNREDCPTSSSICTDNEDPGGHPVAGLAGQGGALLSSATGDFLGIASGDSGGANAPGRYQRYDSWLVFYRGLLSSSLCGQPDEAPEINTIQGYFPAGGDDLRAHSVEIPPDTAALRVTLVGAETGLLTDFDLAGQLGTGEAECESSDIGPYNECYVEGPAPGSWDLEVRREAGFGSYQISTAIYGEVGGSELFQPGTLWLEPLRGPVRIGEKSELLGIGFDENTRVQAFVRVGGTVNGYGPYVAAYDKSRPDRLIWDVPVEMAVGNGFVSLRAVSVEDGSVVESSNVVGGMLSGAASAGFPQILAVGASAGELGELGEVSPGVPLNFVETALAPGASVKILGTGFAGPVIDIFTPQGRLGDPITPQVDGDTLTFQIPEGAPEGPAALRVVNTRDNTFLASNSVSIVLGAPIRIDSVTQLGDTVTVDGAGFSLATVINFFGSGNSGVENFGGLAPGGAARVPIDVESSSRFSFVLPAGVNPGRAYVQALNPPFIPFSSSGNSPSGAFVIQAEAAERVAAR